MDRRLACRSLPRLTRMECSARPPSGRHGGRLIRGIMPKRLRFAIGAGLIVAAIGYLIVTAVRNTAEYYLTVNEVKARHGELSGQMLRVAGRVAPGSIGWNPLTLTLSFGLAQPPPTDPPGVRAVAASVGGAAVF